MTGKEGKGEKVEENEEFGRKKDESRLKLNKNR